MTVATSTFTRAASHTVTRTSLLLVASHVVLITTALGFWAAAARIFDVDQYNQGIVLINALMLIGGLSVLNAHISLPAVLARRGEAAQPLMTRTFIGTAAISAAGGTAYTAIASVTDLPTPVAAWLVLPLGCAAWTVFTLQDGALAGVGRSDLVPLENLIYGLWRFSFLLIAASFLTGRTAMFVAWTLPLAVAIPVVLLFVYRQGLPGFTGDTIDFAQDRSVIRADAIGSLFSQALFRLLPVVALLVISDPDDLAALTTTWLIFTVSDTLIATVGTGLAVADPADSERNTAHAFRLSLGVSLAFAAGFLVFAPLVMTILAPDFGARGVTLLRLIGVALVFRAPLHLALAKARVTGSARRLARLQIFAGVALIAAIGATLATEDLTVMGFGLVAATALAAPWALRSLRAPSSANLGTLGFRRTVAPVAGQPALRSEIPAVSGMVAGRRLRTDVARSVIGFATAGLGTVIAAVAARRVDADEVGGYGLIEALPAAFWVGVLAGLFGCWLLLSGARRYRWVSVPMLLGFTHLAGQLPHPNARFPTAYTHVGFVRYILEAGETEVLIDARFAWPGFFAAAAGPFSVMSDEAINMVLRLWPVAILGIACLLVHRLGRLAYPENPNLGLVAAAVYLAFSWTGQDYFSPQSLGFLAYLGLILLVEQGGVADSRPVKRFLAPFVRAVPAPTSPSVRIAIGAILLIGLTVVSHPLSPAFFVLGLAVMMLYRRQQAFGLLVITVAFYLGWVAFAAELWWRPRIEDLASQFGDLWGSVSASTSDRTSSVSTAHQHVVLIRMGLAAALWLAAALEVAITLSRKRAAERPVMPVALLAFVPLGALPFQAYGGELLIRCFFFSAPFAAMLAARLVFRAAPRRWAACTVIAVGALIVPLFVARFGNESFEMARSEDRAAIAFAYDSVDGEGLLVTFNSHAPMQDQRAAKIRVVEIEPPTQDADAYLALVRDEMEERDAPATRIVVTRTMEPYGVHFEGRDPGWSEKLAQDLAALPEVAVLYNTDGTWVLEVSR